MLLSLVFVLFSCHKIDSLFPNKRVKEEVKTDFENHLAQYPTVRNTINSYLEKGTYSKSEKEALEFLYAYMSAKDIADYSVDFFVENIKTSLEAQKEFSWGKKVPKELFLHFVLPIRVNNEDLDISRVVFFNELKDRIKGMDMKEAALEVNHWCHEKVTYRPADARTSSPLATVRTAYGRCGEESTFAVAALRSVGIPARQCYTPRWAHTDDNHAWVEVWADGKWYFIGACEPEPELNMAWFTFPAKRSMMVHTNVFGKYHGKESKTEFPLFTKINVLENYTETQKLTVKVVDTQNKPLEGVDVKYLLYNYAEYYPIYEQKTDKKGESHLISGKGDILVWISRENRYNYRQVSLTDTKELTLKLEKETGEKYTEKLNLTPPKNQAVFVNDVSEKRKANNKRLHFEDSIRNQYLSTFISKKEMRKLAQHLGLDKNKVVLFLTKSEGNYREIVKYLKNNAKHKNVLSLLGTLTDKDLRDTPSRVLQSHLLNTELNTKLPQKVYVKGILSPRISTELISNWRPLLQEKLKSEFGKNITGQKLFEWTQKNIQRIEKTENYSRCLISPKGILKLKKADEKSLKLFYVALCKSFNVPTYIDNATQEIKLYENGKWITISFDKPKEVLEYGKLVLNYRDKFNLIPQYWVYYTLARYENGMFRTLDFEGDKRVEKLPFTLKLQTGYYRLTSGNRYADGRILALNKYFNIDKNKVTHLDLEIRELKPERKTYGKIENDTLLSKFYKQSGMVILFLEPDREPTKHLLNELPFSKSQLDKWKGNFVFVLPEKKVKLNRKKLPCNSIFVTNNGTQIMNRMLYWANQSFRENYPLVYIVKSDGTIVFHSEGYRIGFGNLIKKEIDQQNL